MKNVKSTIVMFIMVCMAVWLLSGCNMAEKTTADKNSPTRETNTQTELPSSTPAHAPTETTLQNIIYYASEQQIDECNLIVIRAQINSNSIVEKVVSAKITIYNVEQYGSGLRTKYSKEMPAAIENSDPKNFSATFADGIISGIMDSYSFTGNITINGNEMEVNAGLLSNTPWKSLEK